MILQEFFTDSSKYKNANIVNFILEMDKATEICNIEIWYSLNSLISNLTFTNIIKC